MTTSLSHQHLMQLAADVLFTHNARGRIVCVNEPDGAVAPRFYLGRTKDGNIWRMRHDLPEAVVEQMEVLARDEPIPHSLSDLRKPPVKLEAFKQALEAHAPVREISSGPEYCFPNEIATPPGTEAVRMTHADTDVLRPHFAWLIQGLGRMPPVFAVVQDGQAVSVCFSSRISAEADQAGVETIAAYRGRGYAPAVVVAWARAIRELGSAPLYSTSWANLASQGVARKLGLRMFGAELSLK
jgi:RimJ/RimL family protein N-acetyltransferase